MTEIKLAKLAGFCSGVQRAYDLALSLVGKEQHIFTFGELVHNDAAVSDLRDRGILAVDSVDDIREGDAVVIRAHGVGEDTVNAIKAKGAKVFDATCPFVKKIHDIVSEYHKKGYKILIAGDANHDEVKGINAYADGTATVFSDEIPPLDDVSKYCIVFQTTFSVEKYEKIAQTAENLSKNGHKTVVYFDTICYTTKGRQEEVLSLARTSDAVLVVGSKNSANTLRLFELAASVNKNVFFTEKSDGIQSDIKQFSSIAIVGGASTPKRLFEEVVTSMSETQKDNVTAVESVATETEMKSATSSEKTKVNTGDSFSMEDIINDNSALGFTTYTPGKRVKGTVISADDAGIRVALGGKKDGFIAKEDATLDGSYNPENFPVGQEIEALILSQNRENVQLSKKEIDAKKLENEEAEKTLAQDVFELTMSEVVKGGLRGKMGMYTVFVPASQIKIGYVHDLEEYKGKKLRLMVMPPKKTEGAEGEEDKPQKKSRYIFASQRMVLEKEKKEREDSFWNSIHVHDIVVGKVKRFTAIGAFVNVKGYDCLCHISEISWNNISDPSTVLTLNESYDFVVLKMDRESGKISLGYKQLQKKPYEIAADKYPVGTIVNGKVARIKSYGAFIQIEDGVDGLVHVSQIAHNWVKDANEVFQIGQMVQAKIIGFEENRITLSIKELLPPPEETATENEKAENGENEKPAAKHSSRVKKFEESLANSDAKRGERRPKKEAASNEPKEWISNAGSATLGDLFKNLDLNFEDEKTEEKVEKKPAKKAAKAETAEKTEATETEAEVAPAEKKPAKRTKKAASTEETAE